MAVKDLVKRYESQAKVVSTASPSEGSPPRRRSVAFGEPGDIRSGLTPGPRHSSLNMGSGDELLEFNILQPPPRARFMMHPLLKQSLLPTPSDKLDQATSSSNDLDAIHDTASCPSISTLTNPHEHNDDTHSDSNNINDINDEHDDANDEKTRLITTLDDFGGSTATLQTGGGGGSGFGSGELASGLEMSDEKVPRTGGIESGSMVYGRRSYDKLEKGSKRSTLPSASSSTLLPSTPGSPSSTLLPKASKYSRTNTKFSVPHISTPATSVFARNAAPLSLPSLDHYLSSIPAPTFSSFPSPQPDKGAKGNGGSGSVSMFPPMDKLAATGKSLKDLETNSTVAPPWRNPNSILGGAVGAVLDAAGSSAVAGFYSLQGILDTVQIFALILSTIVPHAGKDLGNKWKELFLGTIPNILAMNFASTLIQSLIFLTLFMAIAGLLLYYFFVATNECQPTNAAEGFQPSTGSRRGWDVVVVSFILTVIYLPLSTIAVHALVWSDDFWAVPNPYVNATTFPPVLSPLGPPDQFRDPLDFCYTTTMKRNEANLAPIFVIISAVTVVFLTVWFPLRLRRVVMQAIPIIDKYTELGQPRSNSDLDREYQRLLDRDLNHLNFLYKDFRRGWATYKSFYLFAKLSALLIIAIISPDNCLFRSLTRNYMAIVRQSVLLTSMTGFFILQCILAPFVDPTDNAGEWISRLNYVLTALVGLLVALNVPGQSLLNGVILYIIYIVTYGLSGYFTIINFSWMHRIVKRVTRRIDFSIDIFSPKLDISSSSPHIRRRIWQESISTLFLTSPECQIPKDQKMQYTQALDGSYPPYLLAFQGTPAERHVENLKILREVGSVAYAKAITMISGGATSRFGHIRDQIQMHFVGLDCYWRPNETTKKPSSSSSYFGNAWWIPFPPTLILQYDDSDGPLIVLSELLDLDRYLHQNLSNEVKRKREIRMALRALDGCIVSWPYDYEQNVGSSMNPFTCFGKQYKAKTVIPFKSCVFEIKRRGDLLFKGQDLASGFEVQLTYAKFAQVGGDVIGLNDHCNLNTILARFLSLNQHTINRNLHRVRGILQDYRDTLRLECVRKTDVLSYHFLSCVYNQPQEFSVLAEGALDHEKDLRVRELMVGNGIALEATYERFLVATTSDVKTWWYIFWDDLWRRNYDTIGPLELHAQDFNPHYPTSIAYKPLPRAALEDFLRQRGLISNPSRSTDFFYSGFLNKIYFRLNELIFRGSSDAIAFHLGNGPWEVDLEDVDLATQARPSTLGTGGGTDHDDDSIRARPNYRWEGILDDPLTKGRQRQRGWSAKLGVWFGTTPLWRTGVPSKGLALDVKLENGKYVLLDQVDPDITNS